jgi:hypothetical protein
VVAVAPSSTGARERKAVFIGVDSSV